ncbi:MAG TPA: UDP-N-acetylmuramoyl-L-alanyl-D-glutamate--2,6-diaminopimelate ligase [Sedimentisphaerales bacterium]|nr:UDP-N-acetylmuramoyl-L-alanyl-D-glutamate--2,6-diaminopimelate ligase [Sedimentisphaerales bacterium]
MNFRELMNLLEQGGSQGKVKVRSDSREIRPGDVFVAMKGTSVDGHDYIPQAVGRGAAYIVCSSRPAEAGSAAIIQVADTAPILGLLCQASLGWPSRKLTSLAVTGTKGKTTTAYLARAVIQAAGKKAGLVGTVAYDTGSGPSPSNLTTPDAVKMAGMTLEMVQSGVEYMVTEASSHALDQDRLAGIAFKAAAFTNLSSDHLDYHKTLEAYLAAKMKLFQGLGEDSFAVLNRHSPQSAVAARQTRAQILWYGTNNEADIEGRIIQMGSAGTEYDLCFQGQCQRVNTPMPGGYNLSNHLAAAGLCIGAGFELGVIAAGLSSLAGVPGRLEGVDCGQDFRVLVDYAHTDDAMQNVMETLRPMCRGRLTIVFGCGGDRDKTKRPRMAKVAQELADIVIVTSDNPRTEQPDDIIRDIMAGFDEQGRKKVTVEGDRKKAIWLALEGAKGGDIVLIAGKGHEDYQVVGRTKHHFSDREVVEEWFRGG